MDPLEEINLPAGIEIINGDYWYIGKNFYKGKIKLQALISMPEKIWYLMDAGMNVMTLNDFENKYEGMFCGN